MTIYSLDVLLSWFGTSAVPCPVLTFASWPAFRFLKRQVRWSGILIFFQNFPQFIVIYTFKGFGRVNKAEIDFFQTLAFLMIQWMLAIWSLVPLPFLNPAWTPESSQFMYCWTLAWRIWGITVWDECNCATIWAFFGIAFLWDWNENWHFPVLWPLLCFPNLLAYWMQHFHSIIFQDLK